MPFQFVMSRIAAVLAGALLVWGLQPVVAQEAASGESNEPATSPPEPYVVTPVLLPSPQNDYRPPVSADSSVYTPMDTHVHTEEGTPRAPEPYAVAPIRMPSPQNGFRPVAPDSSVYTPMDTHRQTKEGAPTPPEPYTVSPVEHPDLEGREGSTSDGNG